MLTEENFGRKVWWPRPSFSSHAHWERV